MHYVNDVGIKNHMLERSLYKFSQSEGRKGAFLKRLSFSFFSTLGPLNTETSLNANILMNNIFLERNYVLDINMGNRFMFGKNIGIQFLCRLFSSKKDIPDISLSLLYRD